MKIEEACTANLRADEVSNALQEDLPQHIVKITLA
jgi:hypothetical protein